MTFDGFLLLVQTNRSIHSAECLVIAMMLRDTTTQLQF